jgi:uncharacterized phage infection (PIP) family protein YhgE
VKTSAEPVEMSLAEPDLIDRIAGALPEDVRGEYYRELHHCRSLPESDEMLRILRAMQFLVLLIEQAPSRVAEERERLDKLLAASIDKVSKASAASEAYNSALQRRLAQLPSDVAYGIQPEAIAGRINDILRQEFIHSTIPQTAEALSEISDRMKSVASEFSITSDSLGNAYRGAAEDARKAIASLKEEVSQAAETTQRLASVLPDRFAKAYRWSVWMLAFGSLIIGLALGMLFERALLPTPPPPPAAASSAPLAKPDAQAAQKAQPSPKAKKSVTTSNSVASNSAAADQ